MRSSYPFCLLSVDHFLGVLALINLGLDSFCVLLDKVIFVPDHFRFDVGLLRIDCLLVLALDALFPFLFVDFYIVFDAFHHHLLVEAVLGLS
jgi:hypothetical protein